MIMSGNEARNRNVLDADRRLTETGQTSRCPAGCSSKKQLIRLTLRTDTTT